jgi:outer membrane protein TolC
MKRILAGCLIAAAFPAAVSAKPLSFTNAVAEATTQARSNEAARLRVSAARSAARAAEALPDPRLSVAVENFPVSGPPAFSISQDEMTMLRVGLQQELPNSAKRRAARGVAQAEIGVAEAQIGSARRQVRLGAGMAWIDLAYAERRLAVLDHILAALRPLTESANSAASAVH